MSSIPVPEGFKIGGSVIYGRADDLNRVIELLPSQHGNNLNSTVVSIVADRGTGRTTMLHLLHRELCNAFDTRKYASMPEKYDEKGLMRVIIETLTEIPCDITDLEVLNEIVKEELTDQKLLLLLDNFENNSQKCWDSLVSLLKVCQDTSAVVVTTTREAVGKVKGPIQFYYMNNLSNKWCWTILNEAIFSGENRNADSELADVGKLLVAKCRNVTLCIMVLIGMLRHSTTQDWWRAVLDDNLWETDEVDKDVLPALRICYEYLPSHLKQCFKFCSLFPKEYIFSKEHLVRLWLSQGFIELSEGRELEDTGTEYFDQFLSLSFFQPSPIHGTKEDKFMMPGLIHDLAQQFSKNECFQFEGSVQRAPENACHLSLIPHEFQSISLSHVLTGAQNLQTLVIVSRSAFHNQSISSSVINLVDLKDLIVKFHSLMTLDLNNIDIDELPESLGSLTNLRYLGLSSTKIKRIPLEISNLVKLQTLIAKDCHYLEELPRSIEALADLRYLDVTREVGYIVMPRGIGKLTHLRSLQTFNVGMDPLLHCGIEELKDMEHLKGCLQISGLVNVRSVSDAIKAQMRSKEHIETLCFNWNDGISYLEGEEYAEIAEEVFESLHPTDNLKEIIVRDYPGNSFPKWIECVALTKLVSIIFDHCYNCERLPALGGLPLLRFLSIQKMYSVERMNLSGSEYISENIIRYPSLRQLTIWEMYDLVEWVEIGNRHFPVLHSLCINKCPLLKNIPTFSALVELSASSYAQFLEAMDLPSIQSLRIEGLHKTKSFKLPKHLVGLKKLKISHCPELLSIEGLPLLNSLEKLIIFRCPHLASQDILDGRFFEFEEKMGTSVWLRKKNNYSSDKLDFGGSVMLDVGQDHQIVSKKRKDREDHYSVSGEMIEGHKKVIELDSKMGKQNPELVETTVQRLVEIHSSITNLTPAMRTAVTSAVRSAILDFSSNLILHSEPSPSFDFSTVHATGSGISQDPHTEGSEHLKLSSKRKPTISRWRTRVRVTNLPSDLDDGFSWRKYGQKDILGSKHPRGYYRCTYRNTQGCSATKQVQRSDEDPAEFDILYHGNHTCSCRDNAVIKPAVQSPELRSASGSTIVSPMQESSGYIEEESWADSTSDTSEFPLTLSPKMIELEPSLFDLNFTFDPSSFL